MNINYKNRIELEKQKCEKSMIRNMLSIHTSKGFLQVRQNSIQSLLRDKNGETERQMEGQTERQKGWINKEATIVDKCSCLTNFDKNGCTV